MTRQAEIQKIYPLSPMQQGMLFHHLHQSETAAYHEQIVFTLKGDVEASILERCFNLLIERYEVFRTVFIHENMDEMIQVVLRERRLQMDRLDWSAYSEAERQDRLEQYKASDLEQRFDASRDLLMRVALIRMEEDSFRLFWSHHHLIMDGWCTGIIVRELLQLYSGLHRGEAPALGPVYPYSDYIHWLQAQDTQEARQYWQKYLQDYEEQAVIPRRSRVHNDTAYDKRQYAFTLDCSLTDRLKEISSHYTVTLNVMIQTIWGLLLQRYNGTNDVVFGSVVSGRSAQVTGIEEMVGLFINTIPVRVRTDKPMTFADLIRSVQSMSLDSKPHDDYPLFEIQANCGLKQKLIDHILVFQNYPLPKELTSLAQSSEGGLIVDEVEVVDQTNYDFDIQFMFGQGLDVHINYNRCAIADEMIEDIHNHVESIIRQVIQNPEAEVDSIGLLSEQEEREAIAIGSGPCQAMDRAALFQLEFEHQAAANGEKLAVIGGGERLTYDELNRLSNRIAWSLIEQGVSPGDPVAAIIGRSTNMVAVTLGIVKAGGIYVPIDPEYPLDRIMYTLQDSCAAAMVTNADWTKRLPEHPSSGVKICDLRSLPGTREDNPPLALAPEDTAYIIYTSGTTGKPKGVEVSHLSFMNAAAAWREEYGLQHSEVRLLQMASCAFDVYMGDLARALLNGGCLVVCPAEARRDPAAVFEQLRNHSITILESTPALIILLMDYIEEHSLDIPHLKMLILGSDICPAADFKKLYERYGGQMRIINSYGVTEACIDTSYYEASEHTKLLEATVPIGKPMPNMQMYVLDKRMRPVPADIAGDLYIGGMGVAKGYWRRPDLTHSKFVDNPFAPGEKMYSTGDTARWRRDGQLEFLGRTDDQVKIRGYRIELGEIESTILHSPQVRETAVIAREIQGQDHLLCAYYTGSVGEEQLHEFVAERLPRHMVPSLFIRIDALPLTANGKVDRRSLPKPDWTHMNRGRPLTDEVEHKLADSWTKLLGIPISSAEVDFFMVGGHSLKATQLTVQIKKLLNVSITIGEVFDNPMLSQLADLIRSKVAKTDVSPASTFRQAPANQPDYPVSSSQKRLMLIQQMEGSGVAYNMTGVMEIVGELDVDRLREAVARLVARHEILRTTFEWRNGEPVQIIHPDSKTELVAAERQGRTMDELMEQFIRPFDIGKAPLLRMEIVQTDQDPRWLLFDAHHLIADGVSLDLLIDELTRLYEGESLPEPIVQYKDYAAWHNEWLQSSRMDQSRQFWQSELAGEPIPVLEMQTDFSRPPVQSFEGDKIEFIVPSAVKESISKLARLTGSTEYIVLLAVYTTLLHKYTGQNDILVGTVAAGRPLSEFEQVIGLFVNTLAMRNFPEADKTFEQFVQEVKTKALQVFEHQHYPFEQMIELAQLPRDLSRNPLFQTMLVMQNTEGKDLQFHMGEAAFRPVSVPVTNTKFDITLEIQERDGVFLCTMEYGTKLFRRETMERFARHFRQLCMQAAANPQQKLGALDMLSEAEKHQLLYAFDGERTVEENRLMHQWVERQADQYPDAVAVMFQGESITYADLDKQANRIAGRLIQAGVKTGDIVGIMMPYSTDLIGALIGILKSGGAYLPLDSQYPAERLSYLIKDSGMKAVVTSSGYVGQFADTDLTMIEVDDGSLASFDGQRPNADIHDRDLAYVIYTSGTTGMPKGVAIEHRSISNLIQWRRDEYGLQQGDRMLQLFSFTFDGFILGTFTPLASGAAVVLTDEFDVKDPLRIKRLVRDNKISHFMCVPSLYGALLECLEPEDTRTLRVVSLGGEKVAPALLERSQAVIPGIEIANEYGPTEYSVVASIERRVDQGLPTIGKPIANTRLTILSDTGQLQPIGVPGELCISGVGMARGYWNRPELTAEKFVPHPYWPEEKMYRTGDLARWLPDGRVDIIGRKDFQVKVRGYRIELGEIESVLAGHPRIRQSAVIVFANSNGENELSAYYVPNSELYEHEVKQWLHQALPAYMVPTFITRLDAMPQTASGKTDRKALPLPTSSDRAQTEYAAPRNEKERIAAEVWSKVLGAERVGIHDNFFFLGGDSIKAIKMSSSLYKMQLAVEIKDLFRYPTIAELSDRIQPVPSEKQGAPRLSEAEEQEWQRTVQIPQASVAAHESQGNAAPSLLVKNVSAPVFELPGIDESNKAYQTDAEQLIMTAISLAVRQYTAMTSFRMWLEATDGDQGETIAVEYPLAVDISKPELDRFIPELKETVIRARKNGPAFRWSKAADSVTVHSYGMKLLFVSGIDETASYCLDWSDDRYSMQMIIQRGDQHRWRLTASYLTEFHDGARVEPFLEAVIEHLEAVCTHCCQLKETVLTPSDVGDEELSMDELLAISEMFK